MQASFFQNNRDRVAKEIQNGVVLLHSGIKKMVSSQENYDFRPNKMFYYLAGLHQPDLVVLLHIVQSHVNVMLFLPESDPEKEAWEGRQLDRQTAIKHSGIDSVYHLPDLEGKLTNVLEHCQGFLWMNVKDQQPREFETYFKCMLKGPQVKCIHGLLSEWRSYKTTEEINQIQEASKVAALGVREMMQTAVPGIYEYQLEAVHDHVMKSHGLKSGQYKTILASGKNTTILHYLDNNCIIEENELVLVDIDVEVDHYHCDFTRVFPVSGHFSRRQREVYSAVLGVQKQLISSLSRGMTFRELNQLTEHLLALACKKLGLKRTLEHYYFHKVGHPIGLDTHDVGKMDEETVLTEGMVLTVEPGLYISEEEIGVRIEDIIAITDQGIKNLTAHMEKEIDEIERLTIRKGSGYFERYPSN